MHLIVLLVDYTQWGKGCSWKGETTHDVIIITQSKFIRMYSRIFIVT